MGFIPYTVYISGHKKTPIAQSRLLTLHRRCLFRKSKFKFAEIYF